MSAGDFKKFKLKKTKPIFKGRVFSLEEEFWKAPDGHTFGRQTIIHGGAIAVIPYLSPKKIIMIRQFRPACKGPLLEIPAGTVDPGESLLNCAKRELKEEIGYGARKWKKLGTIWTAPGFCTEEITLYKAWDLFPSELEQDDDEYIEQVIMTPNEIKKAAKKGELADGKSLSAFYLLGLL